MNNEQIQSLLRQILLFLGGGLVTHGYLDNATLNIAVGAVLALATSAWGVYLRRNSGLIASGEKAKEAGIPKP